MNLNEKLASIQTQLKAPKNQRNTFGKYNYRSCEDILEAVKPLLKEQNITLVISDEIKEVGSFMYVESTSTLSDGESEVSVSAQAGIDPNRKGMDIAQSFGSSSSYARKYSLNGLFLIDDTKDVDATNTHGKSPQSKPQLVDGSDAYLKAAQFVKGEGTIEQIKTKYTLTQEVENKLKNL